MDTAICKYYEKLIVEGPKDLRLTYTDSKEVVTLPLASVDISRLNQSFVVQHNIKATDKNRVKVRNLYDNFTNLYFCIYDHVTDNVFNEKFYWVSWTEQVEESLAIVFGTGLDRIKQISEGLSPYSKKIVNHIIEYNSHFKLKANNPPPRISNPDDICKKCNTEGIVIRTSCVCRKCGNVIWGF